MALELDHNRRLQRDWGRIQRTYSLINTPLHAEWRPPDDMPAGEPPLEVPPGPAEQPGPAEPELPPGPDEVPPEPPPESAESVLRLVYQRR